MGLGGRFWQEVMGSRFDFSGIRIVPPTESFDGELTLTVGAKEVRLVEVGPAHTRGDVIVYVPQDRVLYTGDMLFNSAHPAIWAGPVSNWIGACERMLSWDVDVVVPGHGALTDLACIREFRDYLAWLLDESRRCVEAGMSFLEASDAIALDRWVHYGEAERMPVNVYACYRELGAIPADEKPDILRMLELMGERYFRARGGAQARGAAA